MATRNLQARLTFAGGWATDFGPSATVAPQPGGVIPIPFLVDADNCTFELDGGPRKIRGTTTLNASAEESGAAIRGITDFWIIGTSGSPTQKRVIHVGTKVKKDDADGTFDDLITGLSTTTIPSYATYDDELVIMSTGGVAPQKWDGTTVGTFGTNTPNGAFGTEHKNRFWMAGDPALPSHLFYSQPIPAGIDTDWQDGSTSGFIQIAPDDGDKITGIVSFKDDLWIFKGPYSGSIHRITGSTPDVTSADAFARIPFVRGLGAAGHNSIFRFRDDIGFIAPDGTVHSLKATAAFGDFNETALSRPINNFLKDRTDKTRLPFAWAATDDSRECVLITLSIDGSTTNNIILCMDYRFDPVRWSNWPAIAAESLAVIVDQTSNNNPVPFAGGTDGFVRKLEQADRSIDGSTAISYKVTTPFIDYGNPVAMKTLERASVGIQPKGNYTGTFGWTRDDMAQQTMTFDQGGGDVLAGAVVTGVIAGFVDAGGGLVTVASLAHGRSAGDRIAIYGGSPYDGVHTIVTVPTVGTFTITATFTSSSAATWAYSTTTNFFVLGTSQLAGSRFVDRFMVMEEGGEFRSIQYQVTQSGVNQDIELHSIFTEASVGADSSEN